MLNKEIVELDHVPTEGKNTDNLTRKAKLLEERFYKKSPKEQKLFFRNVVVQSAELKAYREEISSLKEGGDSL
ncbi:hypothetical protein [uncultured Methanobrevibacter sp.]|uniref:hypothetical protein n=1 Tax=uncultured Methanobrevibacter sp. TaxID=253161 RepID=UPI0025EBB5A2|nr:hypothetical protein [uncultured Methanobrevibacter sp.]